MLIEPASKVSVPLTVVMRTRSKVPDKVILPAFIVVTLLFDTAKFPDPTQILEPTRVNTILPCKTVAPAPPP